MNRIVAWASYYDQARIACRAVVWNLPSLHYFSLQHRLVTGVKPGQARLILNGYVRTHACIRAFVAFSDPLLKHLLCVGRSLLSRTNALHGQWSLMAPLLSGSKVQMAVCFALACWAFGSTHSRMPLPTFFSTDYLTTCNSGSGYAVRMEFRRLGSPSPDRSETLYQEKPSITRQSLDWYISS